MIIRKEIIVRLNEKLKLPYTGVEQDWQIEMANWERTSEFVDFYNHSNPSIEEKNALMALILCSYDDLLNNLEIVVTEQWKSINEILIAEKEIHQGLIDYWCCLNQTDPEDIFKISPLMRLI